jgi:hypothetical protein
MPRQSAPLANSVKVRKRPWRRLWRFLSVAPILFAWVASALGQTFFGASNAGTVEFEDLKEASGIAASRNNDSVLWTHNDAGGGPRIFAFDTMGRHLGDYDMSKVTKVDYEDIAIGPGSSANVSYIYVGDIGDNDASRDDIKVYQIPEPAVYLTQAASPPALELKGVRQIALTYPDGAHNAELLLVDPLTGDLFIGTKEPDVCRLYSATKEQLRASDKIGLAFVCEIPFNLASGGDISPSGLEIAIRQEDFAQLWRRQPGQSVAEALGGVPVSIPVVGRPTEPNGEAIGFDATGGGYFTLSDGAKTQPLYYFKRNGPGALMPPRAIVPAGSDWRYLDTGADLGTAWRLNNFVDSAWKTGPGQFGYGNDDEQTVVGYGSSRKKKFIATYFRKTFMAANAAAVRRLELKLLFDDGAAVFLNGTRIALVNLAADAPFNALATAEQDDLENTWFTIPVDPSLLVEGTNSLAAEIHQASANSPDLGFDAQLLAYGQAFPSIVSTAHEPDGTITIELLGGDAVLAVQSSTNLLEWSVVGAVELTNGRGRFLHRAAERSCRFYRVAQ